MKAQQFANALRQEQIAKIIGRPYAHHAFDMLRLSGEIALESANGTLYRFDVFVQPLTGLCQTIAFGSPLEKPATESAFQTGDTAPDGRMILAEAPCGRRQFSRAGDREEIAQVVPIKVFAGHLLASPWIAVTARLRSDCRALFRRSRRPPSQHTHEQGFGLIGIALNVAAPANVLIRPHQHKFCLVDLCYFGIVDSYDLEVNAAPRRSRCYGVSGGAVERQQREPGPKFVVQRRAVCKVNARQSRPRQRRGLVGDWVARDIDIRFWHDNRRVCIAVAHFDAVAFVLRVSEPLDTDARVGEGRLTLSVSRVGEVLVGFPDRQSYRHMAPGALTITQPHRAALAIVGLEKSRPGITFQSRGQLPADVERIANAGIHPV